MTVFYQDGNSDSQTIEIWWPVKTGKLIKDENFGVKKVDRHKVLSTQFKGSYGQVMDGFWILDRNFIEKRCKRFENIQHIEIYRNNPFEVEVKDLLTEIQIPFK